MTTEIARVENRDERKELALLKAVGLDRVAPEQRELAIRIAQQYDLDLLLKHLVLIEGRAYITRDGLLHIAHRSGQFDGMTTSEPVLVEDFWRSTCSVFRKDMSHPFTYTGRYPVSGSNRKFAPEMAVKVGEVMALRRAFDVSAPTSEERWDLEAPEATEPPPKPTLAEVVATKAAAVTPVDEVVESLPAPSTGFTPTDDSSMPPRLGAEAFKAWWTESGIPEAELQRMGKALFPQQGGKMLDDYQRAQLRIALEAEDAEAPTEELGLA